MENQDHATIGDGMTQEREAKILEGAIEKWGATAKVVVAIEELSELQKELCKFLRYGSCDALTMHDEMADVSIMLNQLSLIFGDPTDREIAKLERLEGRVFRNE